MGKEIVAAAPSGTGIDFADFKGKLFVIEPLEVEKGIKTVHGESDAVRANVYVLLGPDKVEEFEDTLVFPRVLQGQLRRQIGKIVVGRLDQGEAKKGQNPPWTLNAATEGDLKKAGAFLSKQIVSSSKPDADDDFEPGQPDEDDAF